MNNSVIEERKRRKIESLKAMLGAYVASGKKIEELTKAEPEYTAVKNYDIYVDGKRLNLEERFAYLGYPRTPQSKPFDERLKDIKNILDEFVEAGGNVDDIDANHEIYRQVKAFTPVINGKRLSTEEKFARAGHPRTPKINDMKMFYSRLCELDNFEDEDGYVDSYKSDEPTKLFVSYLASHFDLPISLVVCLLADKKLKKHIVNTDRTEYLKVQLSEYLKQNKNFVGIRRIDPKLYHLLTSISKSTPTPSGRKLTNLELIELLGFEGVENEFAIETRFVNFSEELFMEKYAQVIKANNGIISIADMDSNDNYQLSCYLRRKNETKAQFFERYNVKFLNPRVLGYGKRLILPEYPYLDEMQDALNSLLAEYFSKNPELQSESVEKLFEIKLDAVKIIYADYKDRIEQKYLFHPEENKAKQNGEEE